MIGHSPHNPCIMRRLILVLSIFLISLFAEAQCLTFPISLGQRVDEAGQIIEGRILHSRSFWNNRHDLLYTAHQVEVFKIFKGTSSSSRIEVITEGGELGNDRLVVEPNLEIRDGETGLFFLKSATEVFSGSDIDPAFHFEGIAAQQSFIKYDLIEGSAADPYHDFPDIFVDLYGNVTNRTGIGYRTIAPLPGAANRNGNGAGNQVLVFPTFTSITPGTTTAGTFSVITINGNNFGPAYGGTTNLEFPDANNGGAGYISTPANHIVSWTATSIQARVPSGAGSGFIRVTNNLNETSVSPINLTISYNESNVVSGGVYYQPDLINQSGSGGYIYRYNTTFNGNAAAVASFERALQTWRCATFVNFSRSGTSAISCQALDGTNLVTFDGACALPAGVLGVSYSFYSGCGGGVWYVSENDLKFRTNGTGGITWQFGPAAPAFAEYDFESVCVHELGHSHQLGHTILPVTVMNYALPNGTARRTLTAGSEVAGGNDVMTRSVVVNSCGPGPMVALSGSNCTLNAPTADFSGNPLSGCAPMTVNFTDLSLNTPTSWNWTFTGGTPASSTLQNPSVTYNTPGTYSVTLVATNASGSDTRIKTAYITVNNCSPVAAFNSSSSTVCEGQSIAFFDASTNTPTSWNWTFPGGTPGTSASQNPVITYNTAGTYAVTLTVTNAYGNDTKTITGYVTVNACPPPPAANFSGSPTTVCVGGSVSFTDLTTGSPTNWQWVFPGGTPSTSLAQNPVVTYNTPGVYSVTLTASNSSGTSTISKAAYITVNACSAPTANFSGAPTTICAGQNVSFFDLSTGGATSWNWTFTGGTPGTSSVQNPIINYAAAGTYAVSLTASNAFGNNTKTVAAYITVQSCPSPGSGLIVNDGSLIYVQAGALLYDEGGFINQDNGVNIGNVDNYGTFQLLGDWTNNSASNCFINSSPGTTILSGGAQTIGGATPTYFFNLTLQGSGVKTQTVDARTEGTLALNDRELATGNFIMHVTNPAVGAVTRTGGFNATPVQGFVSSTNNGRLWRNTNSTGSYLFPVGSTIGTARFRPVELKPASASASTFGVRFVNNDPNLQGFNRASKDPSLGVINPLWYQKINNVSGPATTDIRLYYDNIADGVTSFATNLITQWGPYSPPLQWNDLGLAINTGAASPALSSVVRGSWSNYNTENFNISPQSIPLPVDLISFTAECRQEMVEVKWATASEVNCSHFLLERSEDGSNYIYVSRIEGNGTTSTISQYSMTLPGTGVSYYRLTQVDYDGKTESFTPVLSICESLNYSELIGLHPNPSSSIVNIDLAPHQSGLVRFRIYDALGALVVNETRQVKDDLQRQIVDISSLSAGVYHFTMETADRSYSAVLLRQ